MSAEERRRLAEARRLKAQVCVNSKLGQPGRIGAPFVAQRFFWKGVAVHRAP